MKNIVFLMFACFALVCEGVQDYLVRFSSAGPDCYADGSIVVDGECYALVWSPSGSVFAGFNADGTTVSSEDRVVLAAPLALCGRCRDSLFQIPASEYDELKGGEWAVCLVDTRTAGGRLAGVAANAPRRVNRWGMVKGAVKISSASDVAPASTSASGRRLLAAASGGTTGVRASTLSAVPESIKPPRITEIDVGDGEVWLAVADTVPYLSYTIISGAEPGALKTDYFAEVKDGEDGGEIAISTVESAKRRFFQVKRAE